MPDVATPEAPEPTWLEMGGAALRQGSDVVAAFSDLRDSYYEYDPGHNPLEVEGTEEFERDNFTMSRNETETRAIVAQLRQEQRDRDTLERSGTSGFVAALGAGLVSPTVFLPGGAMVNGVRRSVAIGRTARNMAIAGGAAAAASEAIMQNSQQGRTTQESAISVAGATVLGGILGAGASALLGRVRVNELGAQLERELAEGVNIPKQELATRLGVDEPTADAVFEARRNEGGTVFQTADGRVIPEATSPDPVRAEAAEPDPAVVSAPEQAVGREVAEVPPEPTQAIAALARGPGEWVSIRELREANPDLDEATLKQMRRDGRIAMTLEDNQSRLTDADRAAAIRIGSDDMHYVRVVEPEPLPELTGGGGAQSAGAAPTMTERLRAAYTRLAAGPRDWVELRDMRAALPDVSKEEFDRAVEELYDGDRAMLTLHDDQGKLTQEQRDAAFRLGPDDMHMLSLKDDLPALGGGGGAQSAGAAATGRWSDASRGDSRPVFAFGSVATSRRVPGSALQRLQSSWFEASRNAVRDLSDAVTPVRANDAGIVTTDTMAAETYSNLIVSRVTQAHRSIEDEFSAYRFGKARPSEMDRVRNPARAALQRDPGKLSWGEFKEAVARATRRGDVDLNGNEFVTRAAQEWRKYNEVLNGDARLNRLLDPDVKALGAKSWLHRRYMREKIVARRPEFEGVLTRHFIHQRDLRLRNKARLTTAAREEAAEAMERLEANPRDKEARAALDAIAAGIRKGRTDMIDGLDDFFTGDKKLSDVLFGDDPLLDMDDAEVGSLVDDVTKSILGQSQITNPALQLMTKSGGKPPALKARVLNVPDHLIEDFLDNDITRVTNSYAVPMAKHISLVEKFGDAEMSAPIAAINDEANRLADLRQREMEAAGATKAQMEAARSRIAGVARRDVRALEAVRDNYLGRISIPSDPDQIGRRVADTWLKFQTLKMLGGVVLSSLADAGGAVFAHGATRAFRDGFLPFVKGITVGDEALAHMRAQVEVMQTGVEMATQQRALDFAALGEAYTGRSGLERGVDFASDRFGMLTLLSPWTEGVKTMAGMTAVRWHIDTMAELAAGRASRLTIRDLAHHGIDKAIAQEMTDLIRNGGGRQIDGKWYPNTDDWMEMSPRGRVLARTFAAAIVRDVNRAVITPGLEKPPWMSTTFGRITTQYKSFAVASTQRILIRQLGNIPLTTWKDHQVLSGAMATLALGTIGTYLQAIVTGRDTSDWTPARWAMEGLDKSGMLGMLGEALNQSDRFTGFGPSLVSGKEVSRYEQRNWVGALGGPTAGSIEDLRQLLSNVRASDDFDRHDIHRIRTLVIPLQNLFYLRGLFDRVEDKTAKAAGVE